jgi:hypothetical protein
MGMLRALVGRQDRARSPHLAKTDSGLARLAVKTRCVLVADLIEVDADGTRKVVLSGVDGQTARDIYQELTGRPWTATETR